MDSVTSRSVYPTPKAVSARRSTRIVPLATGHGVHLITACLLNGPTSRMTVAEIYEWLAEKYPSYLYTKRKIRHVLRHDSERTSPRFVIANKLRMAGVPIRWTIRPGTESQLRRLFGGPPAAEPQFLQFYGGLSQQIHCVLCNRSFGCQESFARHQLQAHSSHATISPAIGKSPPAGSSAAITTTRHGRTGDHQPFEEELSATGRTFEAVDRNEVVQSPDVASREDGPFQQRLRDRPRKELSVGGGANHKLYTKAEAEAEAETEYVMAVAMIREETSPAEETRTRLGGDEGHSDKECRLDELASVDMATTGDEIMSDAEFFVDAVSCQSSDDVEGGN
ncbi:hypothetical protein B0J14DRAFT_602237 [Halenospora varia]|nr:hypothetical protein B0J14DRAFT_602237 [Halenospora varia]